MNACAKVKVDEIDDFLKSFRGPHANPPGDKPGLRLRPRTEIPKKDLLPRVREIITKIAGLLEE